MRRSSATVSEMYHGQANMHWVQGRAGQYIKIQGTDQRNRGYVVTLLIFFSHRNTTLSLLIPQADLMTAAVDDHHNEAFNSSTGWNIDIETDPDRPHVGYTIISIVQTCFEGLTDPVHSHKTRRLMLQNYRIATKLLRSALAVNAMDRSLAAPMRALALYEVRCEPFRLIFCPD